MNSEKPNTFVFYSGKLEAKSLEDNGKTRYIIKGYISTEDLDLVNDIVTKSCKEDIHNQFLNRNIKLDFEHETLRKSKGEDEIDMRIGLTKAPLGKRMDSTTDRKGNIVEFELNPDWKKYDAKGNVVKTFEEVWREIKSGFLDAFSIAYVPVKTQTKNLNGIVARLLDKINIVNVALTGNPVNPAASMVSAFTKSLEYMKTHEGEIMDAELKSELDVLKKGLEDVTKTVANLQKKAEDDAKEEEAEKKKEKEEEEMEKKKSEKKAEDSEDEKKKKKEEEDKKEAEGKAIAEKIATLEKSNAEMKAILEQPQYKSLGAQKKETKLEAKSIGPLDRL